MDRPPDWIINLPHLPPQQPNERYQGTNTYARAAIRNKIINETVDELYAILIQQGWTPAPPLIHKAQVRVTFVVPNENRDHDNLIAGMKIIYDALQTKRHKDERKQRVTGLLINDSLKAIGIPKYDYEVVRGCSATRIEIWDQTQTTRLEGL